MRLLSRRPVVWTTTIVLIVGMALGASPRIAAAAPVLDQQQPSIQPIDGGDTVGGVSHQRVAQVVQAGLTGALASVDLPVECGGSSTLVLAVLNVVSANGTYSPGANAFTSVAMAGSSLPPKDAAGFRNFTFPTPANFTAGDRFAVALGAFGATWSDSCLIRHAPAGDTYASGDGWFVNDGQISPFTPDGWLCKCAAGSSAAASDYPFRTYVAAPAPAGADLSITKTILNPSNLNVFATTKWIYQVTVENVGSLTATGVTVEDTLPAGVKLLVSPSACTTNAGTLTCPIAPTLSQSTLAPGSSASFQFQVSFDKAGSYVNTATVSANETDPNTSNNTASHTQQVLPAADLSIDSPDGDCVANPGLNTCITPNMTAPGGNTRYDVTVTNLGPDPTGDVLLLQKIPATTTFVSISSTSTLICGAGTNANEFGCRFSSIAVGSARTMTVNVTAPSAPQALDTTFTASHIVPPLILDPESSNNSVSARNWVLAESVTQSVASGGSATTDTENDGATVNDPIETTVSGQAGTVTITERPQTNSASSSWDMLGGEVVISAPAGTTSAPLFLLFRIDSSALAQWNAATLQVYRNYSATPVPNCSQPLWPTAPSGGAPISPDPCVWKRSTLSDGDVEIIVLTSQASVWAFAIHRPFEFGGFEPPMGARRNAGSTLPVQFRLLNEDGVLVTPAEVLDVLASTPSSRLVSCATGATLSDHAPITVGGSGLRFDSDINTYAINWKTEKAWAGTCRELTIELIDGSTQRTTVAFE